MRTFLIEWWSAPEKDREYMGRWFEADGPHAARGHGLVVVDMAWTARVRISILEHDQPVAVVDSDRSSLCAWDVETEELPAQTEGPPLPPRSPGDIRRQVVCGCRDALALGLRAKLLDRRRVVDLLHEIEKSFDPGMLEVDDDE